MHAKLLGFLLFACQIILNESHTIHTVTITENITVIHVSPTPPPIIDANGYTRFPHVNAAYKIYEVEKTWYEARELCISEDARLAFTDSIQKIRHVRSLIDVSGTNWLHVGIHHLNATNQWAQADNDRPLSWLPWAKDNPLDTGDCVGISPADYELGNYECETKKHYVCEITI